MAETIRKPSARLLSSGYANILRKVQIKPRTAAEVALLLGINKHTLGVLLWRMADLRLVHEVEWRSCCPRGQGMRVAVYAFGPGERAIYPPAQERHKVSRWNAAHELVAFSKLIHAMLSEPQSTEQLVEASGYDRGTIYRITAHCRAIHLVRVGAWYWPLSGPPRAMFSIGSYEDAKRPERTDAKEHCQRYYKRKAEERHFAALAAVFTTRAQPELAEAA